jgi:hypothetical protein
MVVGGKRQTPAALPSGKTRYSFYRVGPKAGLNGCEKSRPHQDSIPGPYSPNQSLYRLSYPATLFFSDKTGNVSIIIKH